jgi:hypothetical protein
MAAAEEENNAIEIRQCGNEMTWLAWLWPSAWPMTAAAAAVRGLRCTMTGVSAY